MTLYKHAFALGFAMVTIAACSGSQGDTCTTDSDCHSNLVCQPIQGRASLYCCPTPAESSDYASCHADTSTAPTPTATPTPAPSDAGAGG
jgi:hypothetical protein